MESRNGLGLVAWLDPARYADDPIGAAMEAVLGHKDAFPAGVGVLLLHLGWVQTDMGGRDAPVTIADSVAGLHTVVREASDNLACRFVDFEGNDLPW